MSLLISNKCHFEKYQIVGCKYHSLIKKYTFWHCCACTWFCNCPNNVIMTSWCSDHETLVQKTRSRHAVLNKVWSIYNLSPAAVGFIIAYKYDLTIKSLHAYTCGFSKCLLSTCSYDHKSVLSGFLLWACTACNFVQCIDVLFTLEDNTGLLGKFKPFTAELWMSILYNKLYLCLLIVTWWCLLSVVYN